MQKVNTKLLGIFLVAMGLAACDQQPSNQQPSISSSAPGQTTQPVGDVVEGVDASANAIAVNMSCPVSGEKIDPQGPKTSYKGRTYRFCCDDCIEKFMANPAKYAVAQ